MARVRRHQDLGSRDARRRLKARAEPYWLVLERGLSLGYRKSSEGGAWIVRRYDHGKRRHLEGRIATSDDHRDADGAEVLSFAQAQRKVLEEAKDRALARSGRKAKRGTVRAALQAYLDDLRRHGRADAADEAEGRFKLTIWEDEIASLQLETTTPDDFLDWRDRLRLDKTGKRRQPRSINRHVRSVVAGLNRARKLGHVGNPDAWQLIPLADDTEDEGETAVFLQPSQRRAIIEAADPHLAKFLRALEITGARPKELAAAKAGDFDGAQIRLQHRKGRPAKLRTRYVVLDVEAVKFFAAQRKGKLPSAYLFTMDGELPWSNHDWARAFRTAIDKVNETATGDDRIPIASKIEGKQGASAYSFRHARISELLQVHGIDPLTVAAQTGTSVAMIEKNYFKFIPSAMRAKLASIRESAS